MTASPAPAYLERLGPGELAERADRAWERMQDCDLCARLCRVDRTATLRGVVCRTGVQAQVASFGPHHGEERPLSGRHGSGTIFFSWCNLRCIYCQNWDISQEGGGAEIGPEELAAMMLRLQQLGCHNVNFVSPSHVIPQILRALQVAVEKGLRLPLVYNTGGYDEVSALELLDGVVDVYMPDMKYGDSEVGQMGSLVRDYVEVNRAAVREMHRQVGDLELDAQGIALRGLLVRHLVLPADLAGSDDVFDFLAREISKNTYVNVMAQYHPCAHAHQRPPLDRRLRCDELESARAAARRHGLWRFDAE